MKAITKLSFLLIISSLIFTACEPTDTDPDTNSDLSIYAGTWSCDEESIEFGESTYDIDIEVDSSNTTKLFLYNIYNLGFAYYAEASSDANTLTIPSQSIDGKTVEGFGTLVKDTRIELEYTVNDGSTIDSAKAVLIKI